MARRMALPDNLVGLDETVRKCHMRTMAANDVVVVICKQGGTNSGSFQDGLWKKTDVTTNDSERRCDSSVAINCYALFQREFGGSLMFRQQRFCVIHLGFCPNSLKVVD